MSRGRAGRIAISRARRPKTKPRTGIAALLLLIPAGGEAQTACPAASAAAKGLRQPRAAVRCLADDSLEGRLAGSTGERCAGAYLAAELQRIGLEPGGEGGSWFQSLPLASVVDPHGLSGRGRNLVAVLADRDGAGAAVVAGAHYDHLGRGSLGGSR